MGYAGGTKAEPSYHSLGDHSETVQIDYEPAKISYAELLEVFWSSHDPVSQPWSRQYASIIFYHDDEEKRQAEESKAREEERRGRRLYTEIVPYSTFTLAEGYHQKYRLQQRPALVKAFLDIYTDFDEFVDSTAAARVNGYLGGYLTLADLEGELERAGLPVEAVPTLLELLHR